MNCESQPELNRYIKKPKFSRDQYDYNVSRSGYSERPDFADKNLAELITVITNDVRIEEKFSLLVEIYSISAFSHDELQRNLKSIRNLTPYVLFLQDNFDFRYEDANLTRMVKEAERQNADIVSGRDQWMRLADNLNRN